MKTLRLTDREFAGLRQLDATWDRLSTPEALLCLRVLLGPERFTLYIDAVTAGEHLEMQIEGDEGSVTLLA